MKSELDDFGKMFIFLSGIDFDFGKNSIKEDFKRSFFAEGLCFSFFRGEDFFCDFSLPEVGDSS